MSAAAATGGYIPNAPIAEPIPVGLLLTTPAKILCSALFVSGRQQEEVSAHYRNVLNCYCSG
jgi:hypothetical protein